MPVNTPCPAHAAAAPDWQTIADALRGETTVKAAGETYLPKLYKEADSDYEARKMRATFYNYTARTWEAWTGIITRKAPTIETPESEPMAVFLADATMTGLPFASYANAVVGELTSVSWAGCLIDWSETSARPFVTHYAAPAVINWRTASRDGQELVVMLVLRENAEDMSDDEFTPTPVEQYRVFTLENYDSPNPSVRVRLFKEDEATEDFVVVEDRTPQRLGQPLPRIPFVFHTSAVQASRFTPPRPALIDLASLNLAHYRDSADLRNGLHVAGTPTPWAAGFTDDDDTELLLGVSSAWVSDNPQAKCGFLEFTGAGLNAIASDMTALEKQMLSIGASALARVSGDAEAFQTVALRNASETANLATIAASASATLTEVLQWVAFWLDTAIPLPAKADTVRLAYSSDLSGGAANPQMIAALTTAFQAGAISFETLFHNFQRAELYPEAATLEDEQAKRETAPIAPPAKKPPTA